MEAQALSTKATPDPKPNNGDLLRLFVGSGCAKRYQSSGASCRGDLSSPPGLVELAVDTNKLWCGLPLFTLILLEA